MTTRKTFFHRGKQYVDDVTVWTEVYIVLIKVEPKPLWSYRNIIIIK